MRLKGALHVNSTLPHDGTMTIAELAEWCITRGHQFIAIGEHSRETSGGKVEILKGQSTDHTRDGLGIIPGIEYSCGGGIHIPGRGALGLTRERDPVVVVEETCAYGGLAILAHPYRYNWTCAPELLRAVNAVEIRNVGYDGKYLPSARAPGALRRINLELLAIAGQDLLRKPACNDVAAQREAECPALEEIRSNLRRGDYIIKSRFFQTKGRPRLSSLKAALLRVASRQPEHLRKACDFCRGWWA